MILGGIGGRRTVSLSSQRHNEKLPEVTGTSRGNPGFSAMTRERPRECFKMCWVAIPLPWLESHDTRPLFTRMETWLTWHCTRGSMSSSSYLVRKPTLPRQLEETHETPQSSRDEGLIFLHGLETNHESSLQTEEQAGLRWGRSGGSNRSLSRLERRAESLSSPRDEIRNSLRSTARKQWLKYGQSACVNKFPKKRYRCPTNIGRDAQHQR